MKSAIRWSLLVFALTGISSWAQRGAAPHGSISGGSSRPAATSPSTSVAHPGRRPVTLGGPAWCNRGACSWNRGEWGSSWPGNYWGYSPYSVGGLDPYWELNESGQSQAPVSQQPSVIVVREAEPKAPSVPPASPKVIEVPQEKAGPGKQVPPAVFILIDGEHFESRRYLLTQDKLHLQHGRDQQSIPLNQLDLEATIAANHARGIELQIPDSKNQVTLGF